MNRWYASQAAAERGWGLLAPEGERTARTVGARLLLGVCHPEVLVNHATLRVVDVTGRSLAHIDRLARDWIAHGVAPTQDVDPRKYEVGRLLTFRQHLPDSEPSAFRKGDVLRVAFRCRNGVVGGIDAIRVSDGKRDFVFPEEVSVRR